MKKNGTGGETHINMVSYGGGANSTALLIGLHQHRIPVDLILFADTGAEHPHTYAYLDVMDRWLKDHGMPPITRVYKTTRDGKRLTLEVNRLCTDGTQNACSFLYGAAARAARTMGYRKIITYILDTENGVSLRATGWKCAGLAGGKMWTGKRRPSKPLYPAQMKYRYEKEWNGR